MNIDRALIRSKQGVKILWSLFLLGLAIYIFYYAAKYLKKKKQERNDRSKTHKRRKKFSTNHLASKEETSLMIYPHYSLESPMLDFPTHDENSHLEPTLINDSYNYDDLLNVVQEKDDLFFKEYLSSLQKCLRYKHKKYSKILADKINEKADRDNNTTRHGGKDVIEVLEEILELINQQLSNLDIDRIKINFQQMIWHKDKGLETLIERRELKDMIAKQIFSFKRHQKHFFTSHQNGLILGNSGIGKTKIAQCIAYALSMAGITVKNKYVCVNADKLKSPYIDDTGIKTTEFLESHLEEPIIFEEIYAMTPQKDNFLETSARSHGQDAINTLVYLTDVYKGLCRIYAVGYLEETMERFIKPNEGMDRRFPHVIILQPFSDKALALILIRFLTINAEINLDENEAAALYGMIIKAKENNPNIFNKEAGSMEILADDISNTIYESKNIQWIDGNNDNNIKLLMNGFYRFVSRQMIKDPRE